MRPRTLFLLTLCLLASDAGACSRDDVNFYLDKGFSREQIAALCGGGGGDNDGSGREYREYRGLGEAEEEAYRRGLQRRERDDDELFLQSALDAYDVFVTPKYLQYTGGLCMRLINNPDAEARKKTCPDVRFRVYFRGLEVGDYDRKFFLAGRREIKVTGRVTRKLVENLRKYSPPMRNAIKRNFAQGFNEEGTAIPVRDGASADRVIGILRERVAEADAAKVRRRDNRRR